MSAFHRYGLHDEPVTPDNICGLMPDGYLELPDRVVPFNWMGDIDLCGDEYKKLKKAIADNGNTAVGLYSEIAATPSKVEVVGLWFENMKAVKGLKVKLELYDMCGNIIEALPFEMLDLGIEPCCPPDDCSNGCPTGGNDTFCKYNLDTIGVLGLIGRGNSAILRLTIVEEPVSGLIGDDCNNPCLPMFSGGLIYKSYCNMRGIVSADGVNYECLDGAPDEIVKCFDESKRKEDISA